MHCGQRARAMKPYTGGPWLGGLGCSGAFSRDPEGCYVEKRESCHGFSHSSIPGEFFW